METELQKHFGFGSFRAGQKDVIARILDGQSAAAIFPTGAGKSLCYQLSAILLPHMTLVVSPLLALMKDQIDFLTSRNIPAARLDSTLTAEEYGRILGRAQNGELKILMISVERFRNERFRSHFQRMDTSLLVVDEAHCISEWGHNFRPEYLKLPAYRKEFGIRQVLLLTATAAERVIGDMCAKFDVPRGNVTATGFYRRNLFLQVTPVSESRKESHLLQRIQESPKAPTLVYVTLQKTAERVSEFLQTHGVNSCPYHAGMDSQERELIQSRFLAGQVDCVVATIAFGMGIDKRDIRRVIHFDLPKSIESYSQEIGRSGRDGDPSFCEVLANRDNLSVLENFVYGDTPDRPAVDGLLETIQRQTDRTWEIRLISLSYDLDIRVLPLKTLLVYLDMEGIIKPRYTRFDEYAFKYRVRASDILDHFEGERREFVEEVLKGCRSKKTWTYVDMPAILADYRGADRSRVVAALDYFSEKGWIELQAKQEVEAYEILVRDFDLAALSRRLCGLFAAKESHEIQRIHAMIDFFESDSCISGRLARYFGDEIGTERCGHCSVCTSGRVAIPQTVKRQPLSAFGFHEVTDEFVGKAGRLSSVPNVTKFLCGVSSPALTKLNAKRLSHFGVLDRYPFLEVRRWVSDSLKTRSR
ncbi:MAG: RecQ family ATP-dependent DNA helicase [Phycisphaerales bacterium]